MSWDSPREALTLADESVEVGPDDARADTRARLLGRFVVLGRLGQGGMGEVHAAYDEKLDRKIALKVLHRARRLAPRARARLLREARALARLSHPNVVTVYDVGIEGDEVFIAMELVEGVTLGDWLEDRPRTWGEILEVFVAIGEGLSAAHEIGLVHRDVKPSNVLIDARGRPRLIDFGLVRERGAASGSAGDPAAEGDGAGAGQRPGDGRGDGLGEGTLRGGSGGAQEGSGSTGGDVGATGLDTLPADAPLTRTGGVLGTPQYMSPEQFERREVTAGSDQFSLCVMLYEALYGHAPFGGRKLEARAAFVTSGHVRRPADARGIPDELLAVIMRGLRLEVADRWADVPSLLVALRGLLAAYDPEIEKPAAIRFRRRMLVMLVAVALMVLGGFGTATLVGDLVVDAHSVLVLDAVMFVVLGTTAGVLRRRWMANRQSRRLVGFILMVTVLYCVQDVVGALVGRPLYQTTLSSAVCFSVMCFFVAPLTSGSVRWAGLWAAGWTVVMMLDPPRFYLYFHVANVGAGTLAAVLMPRRVVERWIRAAASERGSSDSTHTRRSSGSSGSSDALHGGGSRLRRRSSRGA